jgi:putative DNA primase/helicase
LPPLAYEREREPAAKRLGMRVTILDRLLKTERGNAETGTGQGRPLNLPDPDPWPDPVDGAALLDEVAQAIRRYVVLDQHEADGVAFWVLAAHAFDAWVIFPRLFVTAPEKQCGKTTLLDLISRLVPRRLVASGITASSLFRTIEAARPTLLLDEADAYARGNEDLRSVLDAGHRRDGAVIRTVGDNHEPRQFSAWAPVALAAIGHLPGTIEDRSIIIRLRRRRPDEPVESLRLDRVGRLEELARKAARWAADHIGVLAAADPTMPPGIYNRAADNWRALLAVADLAGGEWPERARADAAALLCDGADSESVPVQLLADPRALFDSEPSGVLFTREILAALGKNENSPWPEWKNGKPITNRQLAALLKPFKVRPRSVRRGADTEKGYRHEWFDDAFARYLPPVQSVTPSQANDSAAFQSIAIRHCRGRRDGCKSVERERFCGL